MNNTALTTQDQSQSAIIERVIVQGDLSKLNAAQKTEYYEAVCRSLGLNPLTRPFEYLKLQGKETLYARKDATEQLRKINKISLEVLDKEIIDEIYIVTVRATDPTGRFDEDQGAVCIKGLFGEAKANAVLKAITKAKRRTTLSICGLGFLDETEVESLPNGSLSTRLALQSPSRVEPVEPPAEFVDCSTYDAIRRLWPDYGIKKNGKLLDLNETARTRFGKPLDELAQPEAETMLEWLQTRANAIAEESAKEAA